VLGTESPVPTLDAPVAAKVPPGTQHNAQLRLRDKGLPRFGARGHGDLDVRIFVRSPDKVAKGERDVSERSRGLRPGR